MKKITWFSNPHEQRNHLLAHGLMRLHRQKEIYFCMVNSERILDYDVPERLKHHTHRHTVTILIEESSRRIWTVVDSEDSFVCMSPLIEDVDLYFCAGYNTDFFQRKQFVTPLPFQAEQDIAEYRTIIAGLIARFGDHFSKARKFVPIGPNASCPSEYSPLKQKWLNVQNKLSLAMKGERRWQPMFEMFEKRYQSIIQLRDSELIYDVILNDTLWGWPEHRYRLHQKLQELQSKFKIQSSLKWNEAAEGSNFEPSDFPLVTEPINGNYEQLLSSSRLGVFATGFHWGWRNIMTLALLFGIPIYMDKPILEPYFDLDQFKVFYNHDEWSSLEDLLNMIDLELWYSAKRQNQKLYDQYLAPEKVAAYFVTEATR